MIIAFGDLHLSNSRPWSKTVSEDTVNYIINHPDNVPENSMILLGDLTDKSSVDGEVTELLSTLFYGIRCKELHICLGNHDGEIKNNELTYTYKFASTLQDLSTKVFIYTDMTEVTIDGKKCLFLPHKFPTENTSNKDYENIPEPIRSNFYDIIITHLMDSRCLFPSPERLDYSYLKTKFWLQGHIHSGDKSLGYLGSVVPNSVAETDFPRYYAKIDAIIQFEDIPRNILEYKELVYPELPTRCKAKTVVWTVKNAQDPDLVRTFYKRPDMYIRQCVYSADIDSQEFSSLVVDELNKGPKTFITEWFKENNGNINDRVKNKILYYA